jgi:hypothetical protein
MTATTVALGTTAWKAANLVAEAPGPGLSIHSFDAITVATTSLDEQDDAVEFGHLPAGLLVYALIITAADLDSGGSPALVYKAIIGTTDVVTGITTGQSAGTAAHWLATPYTTAAFDKVTLKVTTAAATAAQGAVTVRVLYSAP